MGFLKKKIFFEFFNIKAWIWWWFIKCIPLFWIRALYLQQSKFAAWWWIKHFSIWGCTEIRKFWMNRDVGIKCCKTWYLLLHFSSNISHVTFSFPLPCEIAYTLKKSLGQNTLFSIDSEGFWILEWTFPKFDAVSLNWCCSTHSADSPCNTVLCCKELDSLLSITMWSAKKEVRSGWFKMFSSVKSKDIKGYMSCRQYQLEDQ